MPCPKRLKSSSSDDDDDFEPPPTPAHVQNHVPLIPALPDHLSHLCLSSLPPPLLFSVSSTWRRLLSSPSFPPFPSLYALLSSPSSSHDDIDLISFFDQISSSWVPLPSPPLSSPLIFSHPSFISRQFPVQTLSTSHSLLLISATSPSLSPALPSPLIFHPISSSWSPLPPIPSSPRRWCALGTSHNSIYIASGVASDYSSDLARSFESLNLNRIGGGWKSLAPLRDGRFSREPISMVASEGKLCMVNSAKEGAIYDIESDKWVEMPNGLLTGWSGPATEMEGRIYVVDEGSGVMRRYEWEEDTWTVVMEWEGLKGAVEMAGGGGRVCVTCGGGEEVKVVDVVEKRVWTVAAPEGRRVVAMHVLPRMSKAES